MSYGQIAVEPPPPKKLSVAMVVGWGAVVALTAGLFWGATRGVGTGVRANRRRRVRRNTRGKRRTSRRNATDRGRYDVWDPAKERLKLKNALAQARHNVRAYQKEADSGKRWAREELVHWKAELSDLEKKLRSLRGMRRNTRRGRARRTSRKISKTQLRVGTEHELEHTKSRKRARKIALDHLREIPDYYTRLGKMERRYKRGLAPNRRRHVSPFLPFRVNPSKGRGGPDRVWASSGNKYAVRLDGKKLAVREYVSGRQQASSTGHKTYADALKEAQRRVRDAWTYDRIRLEERLTSNARRTSKRRSTAKSRVGSALSSLRQQGTSLKRAGLNPRIAAYLARRGQGLYRVGRGKVSKFKPSTSLQGAMTSTRIAASQSRETHWLVKVYRSGRPKLVVLRKIGADGRTKYRAEDALKRARTRRRAAS